jgi:arsenate reductase
VNGASTDRLADEFGPEIARLEIEQLIADSRRRVGDGWAERLARERLAALRARSAVPGVLFLCVHNAGRSQMAAGWLEHLAGEAVAVYSGGSAPAEEINRVAVEAMAEIGIDIARQFPKPWTDEVLDAVDVVVTMGCGDECPYYPDKRYLDWQLADPAGEGIGAVREIRDEIEQRVRDLVRELAAGSPSAD